MLQFPLATLSGSFPTSITANPLPINRAKPVKAPEMSHLIMVVDRSGSMYSDIKAMRQTIGQVLAVQEFKDAELLISLVSYSGTGDVKTHFTRVKVGDVMKTGSKEQAELERIEATFLTCISGGLAAAEKLIKGGETTAILVHTDGYANDPSPGNEKRTIDTIVGRLSGMSNVVVNTVVYFGRGDFVLLDGIASKCGGKCIQTRGPKDVYTALHDSVAAMAGRQTTAIRLEAPGTIFALSRSARKIMVGEGELFIRGISDTDDVEAYSIAGPIPTIPAIPGSSIEMNPELALAYARVELSKGNFNFAKQLVLGSRDSSLYRHLRALTGPQLGEFAEALEHAVYDHAHAYVEKMGILSGRTTIVELVSLLNRHKKNFQVNMPEFTKNYVRRGVKKIAGKRDEATKAIIPPRLKTASGYGEWVSTGGFSLNRSQATINMMVTADQKLLDGDKEITEIAGIPLKFNANNNYTVVGDGNVNIPNLKIRVLDKRLGEELEALGFRGQGNVFELPLAELDVVPMTNVGDELVRDTKIVDKLIALRTVKSLLAASTKGQSSKYTAEQMAAFKEHYVTGSGNVSLPKTVHYADKKAAIMAGHIDSYTTYKIEIGNTAIPTPTSLYGANEFLQRHYEVLLEGVKSKKPTMLDAVNPKATFEVKKPKTPNAEDAVQKPWYDQFLGIKKSGPWNDFLADLGLEEDEVTKFLDWKALPESKRVDLFSTLTKKVQEFEDILFSQVLAPTVIYMGATGFLPEAIKATPMTADDLKEKFKLEVDKKLADATFFVFPDGRILSVRPESVDYTTPLGLASIKKEDVADDDE